MTLTPRSTVEPVESEASVRASFQQSAKVHETAVSLVDVLAAARRRCREVLQHYGRLGEMSVNDIQHLFDQLPVLEREVMALHYGCGLNFAEIVAVLNSYSESDVSSYGRDAGAWQS